MSNDWYQRLEGIVHSYKQHIDILEAETIRDTTNDGRAMLRVSFDIYRPGYPTAIDVQKNIMDSKRATFIRRLMTEDNVWVSRLGDGYINLVKW